MTITHSLLKRKREGAQDTPRQPTKTMLSSASERKTTRRKQRVRRQKKEKKLKLKLKWTERLTSKRKEAC